MRVTNRIVATVVALALLAAAVIGLVEIVLAALDRAPWLFQRSDVATDLHERPWDDGGVRLVGILVVIVGLLVMYVALKRSARNELQMQSDSDDVTFTVTRKSLQNYLAGVASTQAGATDASASTARTRAVVTVQTPLRDADDLSARVQAAVNERLTSLRLAKPMQASVKIHNGEK